tara:strand:- start:269 stop:865 length:597 start_codon:yes stop_codon:yes gene_type:complete
MAKQSIDIGTTAGDNTGTTLREGATIINDNFSEIYNDIGDGSTLASASKTQTLSNKTITTEANTITNDGNVVTTLQKVYPIGSIYINATNSTNPGTLLGFGTWTAFGAGRVPVGINDSDTDFDTAEETGGAKTHQLTISELPAHTHNVTMSTSDSDNDFLSEGNNTGTSTFTTSSTGGDQAHNNLQPYIVVYMWKRTA